MNMKPTFLAKNYLELKYKVSYFKKENVDNYERKIFYFSWFTIFVTSFS